MSLKKISDELKSALPKDFKYTAASSGDYLFSHIAIPLHFELFISENSIGLKPAIGNLPQEKIKAIHTLLNKNANLNFEHRTYGTNSTTWSIWEISTEHSTVNEKADIVKKLLNFKF